MVRFQNCKATTPEHSACRYMVPTVSLEWVVETLLQGAHIDFLKIDAQGLERVQIALDARNQMLV